MEKINPNRLDRDIIQSALAVVHLKEKKLGLINCIKSQKSFLSKKEFEILCSALNVKVEEVS